MISSHKLKGPGKSNESNRNTTSGVSREDGQGRLQISHLISKRGGTEPGEVFRFLSAFHLEL